MSEYDADFSDCWGIESIGGVFVGVLQRKYRVYQYIIPILHIVLENTDTKLSVNANRDVRACFVHLYVTF